MNPVVVYGVCVCSIFAIFIAMLVLFLEADKQTREFDEARCHVINTELVRHPSECVCRCPRRVPAPCPAPPPTPNDDAVFMGLYSEDDPPIALSPFDKVVMLIDPDARDNKLEQLFCSNSCSGSCCEDRSCSIRHDGTQATWQVTVNKTGTDTCPSSFSATIKANTECTQRRGNGETARSLGDAAFRKAENELNEHRIQSVNGMFRVFSDY